MLKERNEKMTFGGRPQLLGFNSSYGAITNTWVFAPHKNGVATTGQLLGLPPNNQWFILAQRVCQVCQPWTERVKAFSDQRRRQGWGEHVFFVLFLRFPNMFFLFHTVFSPKTGTFRNAFFPPFCFVLFLFSPQQQKNVFFLNKEKTCFFQNPTLAEGAGKIYCVLIIAFDVQASAKNEKENKERKELRKKEVGCTPCVKSAGFFPANLEGRKKQSLRVCLETPQNPR